MEVILLEKIRSLGNLGDKVKVKRGYGRNYLIPYGKAVFATADNISKFEVRRAELEKTAAERHEQALARQRAIEELGVVIIAAKAGEEGKLFGSIGTRDIADAISKAGVALEKSEIHLPTGVLRLAGDYEVEVELHSDVIAVAKIQIVPEGTSE